MTTFTYTPTTPIKKCVAYICLLDDDPTQPILVIKSDHGPSTWIYTDGDIVTQGWDWGAESDAIQRFYPGDSVTITF
jgi:hypothetical protein